MTKETNDVSFAYAQLGMDEGASLDNIRVVLENTIAYRFSDAKRIENIRLLVEFFAARHRLGGIGLSFDQIRKNYHQLAMKLHPDRNESGNEDQLKEINAAYKLVDDIHRKAKSYYLKSEEVRRELETQAREQTAKESQEKIAETPARVHPDNQQGKTTTAPRAAMQRKYMAASIPRNIRTSRLSYLPPQTVIGSKHTQKAHDINLIFDVVMLPEIHFTRARHYMALPDGLGAHLQYGKFSPAYTPQDTKEVIVPADEAEPEKYARDYFKKLFGL